MTATRPLVILIGPPGSGKSSVGPLVAARLGVEFIDTDAEVGAAAGKPVSDIFIEDGEDTFRELERAAVTRALGQDSALRADQRWPAVVFSPFNAGWAASFDVSETGHDLTLRLHIGLTPARSTRLSE